MDQNKIQGQQNISNQQNNQLQSNNVNVVPVQQVNSQVIQNSQAQVVQNPISAQQNSAQVSAQQNMQEAQIISNIGQEQPQLIRQISPEEVQQAQLSQEELQKTQVLNLKDVEETVRYEKLTSKKPAIIVAVIGAIFLSLGTTVQIAKTLSVTKIEDRAIEKREIKEDDDAVKTDSKVDSLNCIHTALNNADGTDTIFNVNFKFENGKLQSITKNFNVTATVGNPQGPITIQGYTEAYKEFMNEVDGYKISVTPIANGIATNVEVDFTKLVLEQLPPKQQEHFSTSVDYTPDMDKTAIQERMISIGFTCQ